MCVRIACTVVVPARACCRREIRLKVICCALARGAGTYEYWRGWQPSGFATSGSYFSGATGFHISSTALTALLPASSTKQRASARCSTWCAALRCCPPLQGLCRCHLSLRVCVCAAGYGPVCIGMSLRPANQTLPGRLRILLLRHARPRPVLPLLHRIQPGSIAL